MAPRFSVSKQGDSYLVVEHGHAGWKVKLASESQAQDIMNKLNQGAVLEEIVNEINGKITEDRLSPPLSQLSTQSAPVNYKWDVCSFDLQFAKQSEYTAKMMDGWEPFAIAEGSTLWLRKKLGVCTEPEYEASEMEEMNEGGESDE